jgi:hypothetical protein
MLCLHHAEIADSLALERLKRLIDEIDGGADEYRPLALLERTADQVSRGQRFQSAYGLPISQEGEADWAARGGLSTSRITRARPLAAGTRASTH